MGLVGHTGLFGRLRLENEAWDFVGNLGRGGHSWGNSKSSLVLNVPAWSPLSLVTGLQLSPLSFSLATSSQSRTLVQPSHIPCTRHQGVEMYTSIRTQCNSVLDLGLLISPATNRESIESLYCILSRELAIWEGFRLTYPSLHLHLCYPSSKLYNKGEEKPLSVLEFSFIPVGTSAVPGAPLSSVWCPSCSLVTISLGAVGFPSSQGLQSLEFLWGNTRIKDQVRVQLAVCR